eukprot:scaffold124059_cov19-Tisochrysis_lutea.AAC.1
MSGQLDDTFEQAADFVATHTSSLLQEDLLHLYGCAIFTISVPLDSIFCSLFGHANCESCLRPEIKLIAIALSRALSTLFTPIRMRAQMDRAPPVHHMPHEHPMLASNAWSKLGDMTKESAMVGYVECLNRAQPGWDSASHESGGGTGKKSGMGPVFSTMAAAAGEDEPGVGEQ